MCRYGADGKCFDETLSLKISRRNATRTIRGEDFSTSVEMTEVWVGILSLVK